MNPIYTRPCPDIGMEFWEGYCAHDVLLMDCTEPHDAYCRCCGDGGLPLGPDNMCTACREWGCKLGHQPNTVPIWEQTARSVWP